jgi:hypothetical protein
VLEVDTMFENITVVAVDGRGGTRCVSEGFSRYLELRFTVQVASQPSISPKGSFSSQLRDLRKKKRRGSF